MLINSFIIFREFSNSRAENSCPFTHKEFHIEVAWNWILQFENSPSNETAAPSTIPSTLPSTKGNTYVTDGTSLPSAKSRSEGMHLPVAGKRSHCFWCRWTAKEQGSNETSPRSSFKCSSCNLSLCISTDRNCFEAFHLA